VRPGRAKLSLYPASPLFLKELVFGFPTTFHTPGFKKEDGKKTKYDT
jgi:hypothetical protein